MALWHWTDPPRYSFVIDTSEYAGNFERELCAYVIGQIDEHSSKGSYYVGLFNQELQDSAFLKESEDLSDSRLNDPGDDGFMRAPMALAPTPGMTNDGAGVETAVTDDNPYKYPAYHSVAIFLRNKPTEEQLSILRQRALRFSELPLESKFAKRPKILGCRLIEERTVLISTKLS